MSSRGEALHREEQVYGDPHLSNEVKHGWRLGRLKWRVDLQTCVETPQTGAAAIYTGPIQFYS